MAPRIHAIEAVEANTAGHKTFFFSDEQCSHARPGQFVMVWIPGIDEIPMSLSLIEARQAITVEAKGEATRMLHDMQEGDRIGIRGPYGQGFTLEGTRHLYVAGGTGAAPLLPLIQRSSDATVLLGAQTADRLLFPDEIAESANLHVATDDGTRGHHGYVTDLLDEIGQHDVVYTCGPEPMMKKVLDWSQRQGVALQASLERYMKCGIGLCDACAIDGYHVCRDGPVFTGEMLAGLDDFGHRKRAPSGRQMPL
jgi:dihydroorotate dehydrogenase electron transfer subunit